MSFYHTERFKANINIWESSGSYSEIIITGELAIVEAIDDTSKASILCSMSAAAFYLGQYDAALNYADSAYQHASRNSHGFIDEVVRACYLQSAAHRAQKNFIKALGLITYAENYYKSWDANNPKLYAKVLFNKLAIFTDGDLGVKPDKALINELLDMYEKINEPAEKARILIRLANYSLQQNPQEVQSATEYLKMVDSTKLPEMGRVIGHYYLACGRLDLANKQYKNAENNLWLAERIANTHDLKEDMKRITHEFEKLKAAQAPVKTLLHQYGALIAGSIITAAVVGVYTMKSKI